MVLVFEENVSKSMNENQKKLGPYFANASWCHICEWNALHIFDKQWKLNLCDYPCGKKTFYAMCFQMCGNFFKICVKIQHHQHLPVFLKKNPMIKSQVPALGGLEVTQWVAFTSLHARQDRSKDYLLLGLYWSGPHFKCHWLLWQQIWNDTGYCDIKCEKTLDIVTAGA